MGQSNSRNQPSTSHSHTTPPAMQPTVEDHSSSSASNLDAPTSSSRPSRRSLLRRNFLGITNASSPSSSREASLASSTNRRSWLNPRRWSQAPSNLGEAVVDQPYHMDGTSNTPRNSKGKDKEGSEGAGGQSQLSTDQRQANSNSFLSPQTVASACTSDNISEPGSAFVPVDEPSRLTSTVTPISQDGGLRLQPPSVVAETPIADKQAPAPPPEPPTTNRSIGTSENEPSTTAAIGTGLTSDNTTSGSSEPTGGSASTTAAAAAPAASTTRPFPPPGTLVVVQGVVHTTDVPRSNAPSANMGPSGDAASMDHSGTQPSRSPSQDRNGASTRSRLSTLLRPRSVGPASGVHGSGLSDDAVQIIAGGQQADVADLNIDETIGTAESSTYASQEAAGTDEPTAMGNEPSRTTLAGAEHNEGREDVPGEIEQRSDDPNGSGPISSSSIDVLGTLLSVAAAATAASLLTGSSEPILQSNHSTNTLPNPAPNPSVTSNAPSPDFSAAGRAERMRNAWTSIRERLGIRSSGSSNSTNSNNTGASAAAQSAAEAREMMLGEMARAFSVGLGLGSFAGPTSSNNNPPTNNNLPNRPAEVPLSSETRTAPSEGSFERFLMDLQADLRIALTTGEGGSGVRAMAAGSGWNDTRSTPSANALEAPSREGDTATFDNTESRNNPRRQVQPNEYSNDQDVPPLQEVDYAEGDSPHIEIGPEVATRVDMDSPQDGEGQRLTGPGRINWWRLYRFPAIGVPRSNSAAGAAAAAALSTSSANVSPAVLAPSSGPSVPSSGVEVASTTPTITSTTHDPDARGTEDSSSGVSNATTPSTVVPVIIVGLQSVHVDWPQGEHAGFNANDHHLHHHNNDDDTLEDGTDDIFGPFSEQDDSLDRDADVLNGTQRTTTTDVTDTEANHRRGRRWRSRAADAFRSLRTRRGGEQRNGATTGDVGAPHLAHQMPPMGPGSRMFLIYVIGGYYPPNHSIVLGNPADLESFEALSELADLLGQVKPPTATKEEIEKSGLQVFKASKIGEYEREGKIAGNCVERCLICLDDYDRENDIRLMACRHAFHKDCVDRWLETGKNNCPACRSRGVTTETRSTFVS